MAYTMADVEERTGYSPRGVRLLIAKGIVPRPKLRGRATEYDEDFVLRVLAAKELRRRRVPYQTIRTKLRRASPDELMEIAGIELAPAPPPATAPQVSASSLAVIGERWTRVPLAPGLDLLLREGATPEVERLAMKLREQVMGK